MSYSVFTPKERNTITLVLLILLGAVIAFAVRGIIVALLGTMVMYTIFRPMNIWLVEQLNWRRPLDAVVIIVLSFVIIVLPFLCIVTMLTTHVRKRVF